MFNEFVWKLYTESERGKKALARCSSFSDALHDGTYLTLLFGLSFDEMPNDDLEADPVSVDLISTIKAFAAGTEVDNLQQATALFENLVSSGLPFRFPNEAEEAVLTEADLTESIHGVSIGLNLAHPEYFVPYGFVTLFDFLQRIGELFNLALPSVPGKRDMTSRGRYYAQLNEAFYEFRQSCGLSAVEMCAFLYDFAPRFVLKDKKELPEPSKVWPIIAGAYYEDDHDLLEHATEDSQHPFNGHSDMRRGDVLLVYGVSRHRKLSFINHLGRAMFTIGSERVLRETYLQAVSYAYRLRAKVVMLASREGFWLFEQKRGSFSLEHFDPYDWDALQHPDTLFKLKKSLVKPSR